MGAHSVFLDIDGTLIDDNYSGPFEDDIDIIEKAWQKGVKFFLCTGRSMVQIPIPLAQARWKSGTIAAGGAHVVLDGKTLYHTWVPVSVLCDIASIFLRNKKKCSFRGDTAVYTVNQNIETLAGSGKIPITAGKDFALKYAGTKVSMLTVDHAIGEEERALLKKYFDIYPQIPHLDCFMKGEGKAKGMQLILDTLGLERGNSIAIGDSANDMDIMQYAGTGIAVGNACEELKEKASWVSAPVGEGAVAKVLEYLGLC